MKVGLQPARHSLLLRASSSTWASLRLVRFALGGTFSAVADREEDPAAEDQQDQSAAPAGEVKHDPGGDHRDRRKAALCIESSAFRTGSAPEPLSQALLRKPGGLEGFRFGVTDRPPDALRVPPPADVEGIVLKRKLAPPAVANGTYRSQEKTSVHGVDRTIGLLDVLLRHRPRSISLGCCFSSKAAIPTARRLRGQPPGQGAGTHRAPTSIRARTASNPSGPAGSPERRSALGVASGWGPAGVRLERSSCFSRSQTQRPPRNSQCKTSANLLAGLGG